MIQELFKKFLNDWNNEKSEVIGILTETKAFNEQLKLGDIQGKSYPNDKKSVQVYSYPTVQILSQHILVLPTKSGHS